MLNVQVVPPGPVAPAMAAPVPPVQSAPENVTPLMFRVPPRLKARASVYVFAELMPEVASLVKFPTARLGAADRFWSVPPETTVGPP